MSESKWKEVPKILTILGKPPKRFLVTIPKKEVAQALDLKGGEKVRVFLDEKNRRFMYQLIRE